MSLAEQAAQQAYARATSHIRSGRRVEYEAIGRISHRLRNAAIGKDADYPGFVAAIAQNRKLWATLAADVAQQGNELPDDLRARLFWLAEFTEAESRRILRGKGDVAILIEVNAAVMQGLGSTEAGK